MKKIVEETGEGLEALLGERVTLFCCRYIYAGRLTGVNDTCVLLQDCSIVYETGSFDTDDWEISDSLSHDWYVQIAAIESFGILK